MALIVSVSGVRGIVGTELTPEVVVRYAAALGETLGPGTIALGRDSRPSGGALRHAAIAGLAGVGCSVLDLGIVPTPTCGLLVRELNCRGGLQITASHNPAPYNGLKLFGPDGAVLPADEGRRIQSSYERAGRAWAAWDGCGSVADACHEAERHPRRVLKLTDVAAIRARNFRVVLDANGGAGGPLARQVLAEFGCEVTPIGCEPDGVFQHEPEPVQAHLGEIEKVVAQTRGAIGCVLDPDADRLALIAEGGRCLSEELTLALAVQERLHHAKGPIVVNLSSSRVTADIAARAGVPLLRAAVGEANVVGVMRSTSALIGGEGNGGVIDPRVGWVRDPFIGIGLILGLMARTGETLADLAAALPQYTIQKDKYPVAPEGLASALAALPKRWPEAAVDTTDGVRLDWADRWVHVRGSNTEPIVRVIAEAPDAASAAQLCRDAGAVLTGG